jgi:Lon protease-like protein
LGIVVYPGEAVNLHIFEPRYKQLIIECFKEKKLFGIPTIIDNHLQEYGTSINIKEITTVHDNGELDIKTEGADVFRILEVIKEIPDRLYSGGIVNYPVNNKQGSAVVMKKLVSSIKKLHKLLKVKKDFKKKDEELKTYDIAHHVGLSLQEEYELLCLVHERQRQEYLTRHLIKVMPMLAEMEGLKKKVKLNGHFKNLTSFDFDI